MSIRDNLDLARNAAQIAQRAGANDARVKLSRSREIVSEWRDGQADRIRESTKQRLTMALFVDGRYSGNSTSDLRPEALGGYIQDWVATSRALAVDEHRRLPPPTAYEGMSERDLEIRDPATGAVTTAERLTIARQLEEAARAGEGNERIISVKSWASDTEYEGVCVNTNSLEATEQGTHSSRGVSVSIRDSDDRKPRAWAYGSARHREDLPGVEALGRDGLERAIAQLGTRQVATGRYAVVIENRAVPRFTSHLLRPLSGSALQQKSSFLEGRLGEQIGSKLLSIRDDPHLPRGPASTAWDSEGMATRPRPVFEAGVLRTYFLDTYYASKLGSAPTTGSTTNLLWQPGSRSGRAMLADVKHGLYVTSFLGGNSNGTTGDFSVGIKGFYVEDGVIQHPISEMNVAGNLLEFWKQLVEVGNDPWRSSSHQAPSLRFDDVQCSGA